MKTRTKWLLAVLVVLAAIYLSFYFRPPTTRAILQTSLARIKLDIFQQRQPLVFEDRVSSLQDLQGAWFRRISNPKVEWYSGTPEVWMRNKHKYIFLQPQEDTEILILHAGGKRAVDGSPKTEETLTAIPLMANQVVCLPFRTMYHLTSDKVTLMAVHDWITLGLAFIL
jgi:hypothetical protein